jgi:drug/metabolite transporter (DMT)-like permease
MKKIIVTLLLICAGVFTTIAQQTQNPTSEKEIEMKLNFLGYRFYKNGERLNWKELVEATASVEEANLLIKRGKSQNTIANLLAITSGTLTGIVLAQEFNDREPTWELAYASGGLLLVGFHLSFRAFNNVNKGVDSYNIAIASKSAYRFEPEFHLVSNQNGIGLALRF